MADSAIAKRGPSIVDWIGVVAILLATFFYNRWLLDAQAFFFADDWQWLYRAEFLPWDIYAEILPSAIYNDRPVGAALIKLLYRLVGLNHLAFQVFLLVLHAVNCVLLYAIAVRYTGRPGALLAALLAAMWFSANRAVGWSAAIFDLFGATLCLATLLFRQLSIRSGNGIRYDLAGAACYLLAIRTKEFALGAVIVLLLMNVIAERQSFRASVKQLLPYLIVFAIYAAIYTHLLATTPRAGDDPYHLDFSVATILASLRFYVSTVLNGEFFDGRIIGPAGVACVIAALAVAMMTAGAEARRIAAFGLAGFVIMLGPTLLLPTTGETTYHDLYLYTPHFFMALVIGSLFAKRTIPTVLAAAVAAVVVFTPTVIHARQNIIDFYLGVAQVNRAEFTSAVRMLTPLPPGTTVFIAGVEPFLNPFAAGPGFSLNTAFKDRAITVVVDKPETELLAQFCELTGPKRFLAFAGKQGTEVTAEMESRCRDS